MLGDDPPYLTVGTEVSAKYKGAFCEAKVRKVVRSVKCKVTFKLGLGSAIVADDQVRGTLRVGSTCEVKHPEKKEFSEAILNKIQDCSQYTVVFDDGDITTLRRSALCLKSGRHFAESETLDQLPLTHPEHFSNPVIGGRKGRRSRQAHEESSEEEGTVRRGKRKEEKEEDIGRMVCVELGDKKKQKDNWFPGLVVAPTAQDTVRIKVRDEYLVRSFKDGRYFTVPKKEATEFTREIGAKVENNTLKTAVEKALLFLDRDELPPHWDRDLLFGVDDSAASDSDGALDSDSSDDEPREEKDHFVAQLYKFMDDRGTPINKGPAIGNKDIDLYKLFKVVHKLGGYNRVTNHNQWKTIAHKVGFGQSSSSITNLVKQAYKKFLHSFEEFYRKLGCTMVNHPRGNRARQHAGRSLIRDRDRATPVNIPRDKDKAGPSVDSGSSEVPLKELGETVVKLEEILIGQLSEDDSTTNFDEIPKEVVSKRDDKLKPTKKEICPVVEEVAQPPKANVVKEELIAVRVVKKEKVVDVIVNKPGPSKEPVQPDAITVLKGKQIDDVKEDCGTVDKSPVLSKREEKVKEETKVIKPKEEKPKSVQHKSDRIKVLGERSKVSLKEEKVEVIEKLKEEVKEEILKTSEDEKSDKSNKKRLDKKEDEEKQTRSKSKEDLFSKKDMVTPERRSRDFEKRLTPRLKKPEEEEESLMKRGRKRKDMEPKPNPEEGLGQLSSNIAVGVGDKLKVYYGPTHESKVTYEAKVIDMEKDTFLVHYTGWNTRYDEWIKRGRIAENLSWTPSRAKRLKQQQGSKAVRPSLGRRGRPSTSGRDSAGAHRPRSTTPSSVTSSRSARPPSDHRRRTRRTSGHTDASVASGSESESDSGRSEPGVEPVRTRSRSERLGDRVDDRDEAKRPPRRLAGRRKDVTEVEAEDEREDDIGERSTEAEVSTDPRVVETRRSKRTRKTQSVTLNHKEDEQKREPSTESEEEQQQPKGRDFDLNQIRSELKGIEKAVKQPQDTPATDAKETQPILDDKTGLIDVGDLAEELAEQSKPSDEVVKISSPNTSTDDIYEFKEPEPFDFEVRSKRDVLVPEERPKLNRKQAVKLVDEVVEAKIEKPPTVRKKLIRNALQKTETNDVLPLEGVIRKRFRRNVVKSIETPTEVKKKEVELGRECSPEPTAAQKNISVSACEEAFDKLCESPVFRPASQPRRTPSPSPGPSIEPLSLFSELPGEGKDNVGDDSEDRSLVISETEETETELEEPLFTYPQRHHEELLPTLPVETHALPVVVSDQSQNLPRIQLSAGGFSTFGKNVVPPNVKNPTLRKKSSIPVIDKKASKPIANKKEASMISKRKELGLGSTRKESDQTVSKKEQSQIIKKDVTPSMSEDESEAHINTGNVSPVNKPEAIPAAIISKDTQTLVTKKESTPIAPKKESSPIVSRKESIPNVPKKELTPVVSKKELSPDVPMKELSPIVPQMELSPIVMNTETIPIVRNESSPILKKETIPILTSKTEPNALPTKEISSIITKKESTPIIYKKDSSPVANKKAIGLNLGKKESSLPIKKSSATIVNKKESSPTLKRKDASPVNKKKDFPLSIKKNEPALIIKEEEETVTKETVYTSPNSRLASDNLIEVDDDMYADDPISAAIQRVISQAMSDEDSNDFDVGLVVTTPPIVQLEKKVPKPDVQVPISESQKKDSLKRKSGGRKPVLSQEFVEDSDSDSSDEEHRLVIAKTDDDDSQSRLGEESSSSQSLPKPSTPKESQLLEATDDLHDEMLSSKEDLILNKDDSSIGLLMADEIVSSDKKSITEDSESKHIEEVAKTPLLMVQVAIDKSTPPVEVASTKKDSELLLELCDLGSNVSSEVPSLGALTDVKNDDNDCSVPSLLCEETIPGSPTPMSESAHDENICKDDEPVESRTAILEMPFASAPSCSSTNVIPPVAMEVSEPAQASLKLPESTSSVLPGAAAAPVIENTPPTTPDSSLSITSGSPTEEHAGMSPTMDNESVKSRRDSFEGDSSAEGNKVENYSDEDSLLNIELSNSSDNRLQGLKCLAKKLNSDLSSPKKRRRSRKRSECDSNKRLKSLAGQSNRLMGGGGSDSDDTSENSTHGCLPLSSSENMLPARSPRPSKYNFYVELDPELDGSQRIALLQQKLQELRKTYVNVKAELACIDRRRKKLRRREREDKATKPEVVCS